jgi:UDP-glucose 4-epimerase
MFNNFENKTLMITGGTGSFGKSLLKNLLKTSIKEIRIFSRDEKKQEDLRIKLNDDRVKFYIGDVRDYDSLYFAMFGVDYIFHAAALKQVPSCEFYPLEAVKTNILGTENILKASIACHVEKLVLLSTDKAVYPINAMGISKAMAEKILIAQSRLFQRSNSTIMSATRYGNVMASRGSIIPLIVHQIKNKQDITITDPEMTRFLMSLEDSVNLVMFAFENSSPGDIFIQKSPATTLKNLCLALLEIFNVQNNVQIIGTRHGEKLHETLVSREEMEKAVDLGDYYRIPADNRDLNYRKYFNEGSQKISNLEDYTSFNTTQLNVEEVKSLLLKLDYIQGCLDA